ncbi:hypothetical protein AB0F18_17450 [Streptomyces sp. NPDC029216]|uniref:hypothetical protein n=1 Tax=Streptomyces sp. NPDC029216 TaxID=3154701 RepID=UPI0034053FB0
MSSLLTLAGLGIALPFAVGITPAYAQGPDLEVTKTHEATFPRGGSGVYTITVTNTGTEAYNGQVTLSETLPTGLLAESVSAPAGWSCQIEPNSTYFECVNSGPILPDSTHTFLLRVDVLTDSPCSVTNRVGLFDADTNQIGGAEDPTTITGGECPPGQNPLLSISKSHTGTVTQGGTGTYTISVSNAANAQPTTGTVTVTDTMPTGVTPTAASGTGWNCSISGQTVTCTRSDALAPGASYPTITVTANVTASVACTFSNTASVSGGGSASTDDSDETTVTGGTCTPAQNSALSVNKSHTNNFTQGGTGTYAIDVANAANAGPTTGTVTVTDTLPAGVTPTAASGTGWNCGISGQTVTCTRTDALAAGASYPTITVTTNVTTSAPCTFTNTASVSGGGSPNASDNDPTTVTGGTCSGGNGGNGGNGGGGSILPINLNGVFTMFNNISTNNNINSPGGTNTTNQNFTKTTN